MSVMELRPAVSHAEVLRVAGVSYRQGDYWARLGVFGPERHWTPNPGSRRPWTVEMIEAMYALGRLSELGAKTDVMRAAFDAVIASPVHPDGEALIVTREGIATRCPHWCIDVRIEAAWVVALRPLAELSEVAA